jgi:hypothetical protein
MNNAAKLPPGCFTKKGLVGALNSASSAFGILETTDLTLVSIENVGEATRINGT